MYTCDQKTSQNYITIEFYYDYTYFYYNITIIIGNA